MHCLLVSVPSLCSSDDTILPFRITIPQSRLTLLQQHLALVSLPTAIEPDLSAASTDADRQKMRAEQEWARGTSVRYLDRLLTYWRTSYDWRKREAALNTLPHFTTQIDGLTIHFVHARSTVATEAKPAVPLLFVHGWPGSFLECTKILPLLTSPSASSQLSFDVVCPSLPGYGFSSIPSRSGFGPRRAAQIFHTLMLRLGYSRYVAQGGDWGSVVTTHLAEDYPNSVAGLHVNMAPVAPPLHLHKRKSNSGVLGWLSATWTSITTLVDLALPHLRFSETEAEMVVGVRSWGLTETAYFFQQSTKPDSLGIGLDSSPVALASWLVEKYRRWSGDAIEGDLVSEPGGGIETRFPIEELLDHLSLYYLTGTILSSIRFYHEAAQAEPSLLHHMMNWDVSVPTGVAAFPGELGRAPQKWLAQYYNLKSYTMMPCGGHFPALEQPQLLVDDIRQFVSEHVDISGQKTKRDTAPAEDKQEL